MYVGWWLDIIGMEQESFSTQTDDTEAQWRDESKRNSTKNAIDVILIPIAVRGAETLES